MNTRTLVAGSTILLCLSGFLGADEFAATLVKIADGKVTFSRGTGKKKKESTLPADEKCRVVAARYNPKTKVIEAGDEIGDGLKNARLQQLDKESIEAWIRTDAEKTRIVEMRLFQTIKKKK